MAPLNLTTAIFLLFTYGVGLIFVIGVVLRIYQYATTPQPVKIPLTPAPLTSGGAFARILGEVFFFKSLFRSNKPTWVFGYLFHISFFILIFMHFLRHFIYSNPLPWWYNIFVDIGIVCGIIMVLSLFLLLMRRVVIERVKFISLFADYLILILLMLIGLAGLSLNFVLSPAALTTVDNQLDPYMNGLLNFQFTNIPSNPLFLIHYTLVMLLIAYIPFSKVMHFVGIFFSPTRIMADNPEEERYYRPNAKDLSI
ncbi:MAG: respiratory nitrate reductase subunit gamma [Deltaproteobacteria bacterium]|nr:respiratory nitrate reductase subunit gamma [Deltaproteobacteria bacterium]MCL5879498.1 respiratory nitrate reductase subunit gamma [Deltaproteobacteria bacterium]MDA8305123.1 respiratory nitrate reductase subunit gamma [Deltaproteobacteria bacterium]